MRCPFHLLPAAVLALLAGPAPAAPVPPPAADPGQQCRAAIAAAEGRFGMPAGLMAAIGRVESGRRGADGRIAPWPWSIDAAGSGRVFATKAAAITAVRTLQGQGVRSIDVGCMQVNLLHHPDAFASLDAAFDPEANVAYAARFLRLLHAQTGTWPAAAALYHSATPALAADYQRKVMAAWPAVLAEAGGAAAPVPPDTGAGPGRPGFQPPIGGVAPGGLWAGRVLPRAEGPPSPPMPAPRGRTLAAYRAAPIPLAAPLASPRRG
ncbi:MAG TPA: lytic transglycosylase domain-containing protein [Acetobacteraceae bacterium]|nr:lytic transglycosylase domain-containing protein [Acetobacteraceae bacterium]